jgi:hypothetical protein
MKERLDLLARFVRVCVVVVVEGLCVLPDRRDYAHLCSVFRTWHLEPLRLGGFTR